MTIGSSKALLQLNKLYAIKVLNNRVMVIVFSMTIIVLVNVSYKNHLEKLEFYKNQSIPLHKII